MAPTEGEPRTASLGDRVRDRISEDTGTVKDHFMNQAIICWDQPDENGNQVSSVPAEDLEPIDKESDAGSPAKKNTDAATETPSKENQNES